MRPRPFAYVRAAGLEDALAQLARHGGGASPLAGGMSLIPLMKYRQRAPAVLVDIGRVPGLAGISRDGGALRIGATTRHADAAAWPGWGPRLAMFPELASRIGDQQVRNMGTVGGSLAAVEPTGDWGTALLAMGGQVTARTAAGERRIGADAFFLGTHRSALSAGELLTEASFPLPAGPFGTAAAKFESRTAAPLMSCAALVVLGGGRVARAGVACAGLAGWPVRLPAVEEAVRGQQLGAGALEGAVTAARDAAGGFRGSVLGWLVREVLARAGARAQAAQKGEPA